MLLFDTLQMASNSLSVSQLGMQVAGQNLSNAQTPGYVREQLILETGTSRNLGSVVVGTGVNVSGVTQVIDNFLEERLRSATSDAYSTATQYKYSTSLEALLNETTDLDLSSSIEEFFNSIDNVLNHPENETYREMVADQGEKLTDDINRVASTVEGMQQDINTTITQSAEEINRLVKQIDELNKNITLLETQEGTEALGLRDQRLNALSALSMIINIKTTEDATNGSVSIYCGSDILLMDGVRNEVSVRLNSDTKGNIPMAELCVGNTQTPLDVRSGSIHGLYESHQTVLGNYLEQLDEFAVNLIQEFNNVYTSGQGLTGYTELTSLVAVDDPSAALSDANLDFPVNSGEFIIQVYDTKAETTNEYAIPIHIGEAMKTNPYALDPTSQTEQTSLEDIAEAINAIDGLKASVNIYGQLEIVATNTNTEFAFAEDSTGVLAALGINTFFTGSSASTIGINGTVKNDPSKFAASLGGVGNDTGNGVVLAALGNTPNANLGGSSIIDYYGGIVSQVMLTGSKIASAASSDSLYQQSLQTQRDSISGVNVDEETIQMMTYQRMFQANSRLVTMINEMLDTLIAM